MKEIKTISIRDYLIKKGIQFIENNGEIVSKCIFNGCDKDSRSNEAHLYFDTQTGKYQCKKCGTSGNIFTLVKYFGDCKDDIIVQNKKTNRFSKDLVEECNNSLPIRIREYLNNRGISDEVINMYKIGYGHFYKKNWITTPIKDEDGNYIFFKLREDPDSGNDKITFPKGVKAQVYDWNTINDKPKYLIICEGELDRLLLLSKGIQAITSTHGANTFKREWIEKLHEIEKIVVCFDNDKTGKEATEKLLDLLHKKTKADLYRIDLPQEVGDGGDITDYFIELSGTKEELFSKYMKEYPEKIDSSQFEPLSLDNIADILDVTIKQDKDNKITTFLCSILVYTDNDQFNISFNAPSSTGKSYIPLEISALFPDKDIMEIGYCSPTAFFHDNNDFDKDFEGYIMDLSRKILIFIDQPRTDLLQRLRSLLSHDRKEIITKITDKTQRYGLKTKNVKLIGFPVVIFCTAGLKIDEQEATRFLLLSPETTQIKLNNGVNEAIDKESDRKSYIKWIEENPERKLLKLRVLAIRNEKIAEIIIENKDKVKELFLLGKKVLKPRHQRDVKRVMSLIKANTLLNIWWRKHEGSTIYANDDDIEAGFKIWNSISESQELNLPPYILNLFKEVIIPVWNDKNSGSFLNGKEDRFGVTRKEIMKKHMEVYGKPIADWQLRQQILSMLETAGLIYQEPDPSNKRRMLIFPIEASENKRNSE